MIAGRRLLARQDDVAPGFRPRGHGRRARHRDPRHARSRSDLARARRPPPCRAAARKARPARSAGSRSSGGKRFRRARIERRAVGIARPWRRRPRAARPAGRSRRGSRRRDRSGPAPPVSRAPRDSEQNAPTAAAPAFPRRCRARRGLRRSPPRIPAGNAWRRYPRSAAGTGRRSGAPGRNSAAPNRRGRDGDSRSGSAQIGKRVAACSISSLPGLTRQSIVQESVTIEMDTRVKPAHDELSMQ